MKYNYKRESGEELSISGGVNEVTDFLKLHLTEEELKDFIHQIETGEKKGNYKIEMSDEEAREIKFNLKALECLDVKFDLGEGGGLEILIPLLAKHGHTREELLSIIKNSEKKDRSIRQILELVIADGDERYKILQEFTEELRRRSIIEGADARQIIREFSDEFDKVKRESSGIWIKNKDNNEIFSLKEYVQPLMDTFFKKYGFPSGDKEWQEMKERIDSYLGDKEDPAIHWRTFDIPENDRLKNFQLVMKFSEYFYKGLHSNLAVYYNSLFKPSLEKSKIFELDEDIIPVLMMADSKEGELPFPQTAIECSVNIDERTYYCPTIGSFYTEDNVHYRSVLCCYSKMDEGENKLFPEYFVLEEDKFTDLKLNKHQKKLKNFILSFLNFINEPEVQIEERPLNPKNNERREIKGRMPLPANKVIRVHGSLKLYIEEFSGAFRRGEFTHRFHVRSHFIHFRDKKRYRKLYSLNEELRDKMGFTMVNGIIRRWVKPCIKGKGLLIEKTYKVVR